MFLYESASRATGLVGPVLTDHFLWQKKFCCIMTDKWFYDNLLWLRISFALEAAVTSVILFV